MNTFWLCFVPLFVAVDPIGLLPLFLSLTEGMEKKRLRIIIAQSVITAATVGLAFLAFGPALLEYLGITVPDFMIAGGILLLVISLSDLLTGEKTQRQGDFESLGAVPIGVPLITGPAVLTTSILLAGIYGQLLTGAAILANVILTGLVFLLARPITRLVGRTGAKTLSKVASMLLAAIAVMLIRRGLTDILTMSG